MCVYEAGGGRRRQEISTLGSGCVEHGFNLKQVFEDLPLGARE